MDIFFIICSIILGLIVGSFLGVVVARIGTGKGIGGRSQCLSCRKTLSWYELIPIVSFFAQRGKCSTCKSTIPKQDLIIEIMCALVFGWIGAIAVTGGFFPFTLGSIIMWGIIGSLCVGMSVYDIGHRSIPTILLYPFLFLALLFGIFGTTGPIAAFGGMATISGLLHALSGAIVAAPFFILWLVSKGTWIGFGDIEIMIGMGFMLPTITHSITAVVLGFWIGAAYILALILMRKLLRIKDHIERKVPFAPFLFLSLVVVGTTGFNLFRALL
jgi:prepilin signal peptidase PulO-like enzyme (type II secretory pathway)